MTPAGALEFWSEGGVGFPTLQHRFTLFWDPAVCPLKPEVCDGSGCLWLGSRYRMEREDRQQFVGKTALTLAGGQLPKGVRHDRPGKVSLVDDPQGSSEQGRPGAPVGRLELF